MILGVFVATIGFGACASRNAATSEPIVDGADDNASSIPFEEYGNAGPVPAGDGNTQLSDDDGGYSILDMDDVVNTLRPHVRQCYDRMMARIGPVEGRIRIQIKVNTQGLVEQSDVVQSTFDDTMNTCVLDHARRLRFQELPANGSITLQKVFLFQAQ